MARKMPSRKQRQKIVYEGVAVLVILCGIGIWWQFQLSIFFLVVTVFVAVTLGVIASSYAPDMRKKENKNKNPFTGLPQKTAMKKPSKLTAAKKQTAPAKSASSSERAGKYGVRPDNVILQLPLEELSGLEFEQLVFLYFKAIGYKPVKTPEAKDGGVDMILTNKADGLKIAVQVKHRYKSGNQITVKEIRELDSAKKNHRCISSWFITSGTFTNAALVEADTRRMKTSDITYVENKIIPWKERETAKITLGAM
ncbi:restriction endonuclease [Parageobacillus thermoglucosidasius]|uniref:restriction endonuclease n=1 Tax=Parageobacillus thermoglucosidasius TaxID=1426 RepID=UPI0001D17A7C|nr:restriction endonuclease [Parageobacillus thermoglucosidasius]AEH47104.1 restriction endonuclease [Parageobacillus thermoglucosidasius C56-YS93]